MNQAGMFAPDINFTPAAGVYPTAAGGTSAAAASAMSATTNVTVQDSNGGSSPATVSGAAALPLPASGKTIFWWLGFVFLLIALVVVARKAGNAEDFRNLSPTFYNFMAITLTSVVGIAGLKVLAAKYHVPGASDIILAV
jgi:hypothetical protein